MTTDHLAAHIRARGNTWTLYRGTGYRDRCACGWSDTPKMSRYACPRCGARVATVARRWERAA